MPDIAERVRARIQDPRSTTSVSKFIPREAALFPPVPEPVLLAAEVRLGFRLPPLLRELYTQVANGGFGPGYGIFGLEGGFIDQGVPEGLQDGTLLGWYFTYRGTEEFMPTLARQLVPDGGASFLVDPRPSSDSSSWFDRLVPICNHGDWQISCVDCANDGFPVFFFDGQQGQMRMASAAFDQWIVNWLTSD